MTAFIAELPKIAPQLFCRLLPTTPYVATAFITCASICTHSCFRGFAGMKYKHNTGKTYAEKEKAHVLLRWTMPTGKGAGLTQRDRKLKGDWGANPACISRHSIAHLLACEASTLHKIPDV